MVESALRRPERVGVCLWTTGAVVVALLLALSLHESEPRKTPHLLQSSRLILELPSMEPCNESGNAIVYTNYQSRMVSKVDFGLSLDFNITRTASKIELVSIRLTKCREVISSNTCELFQTWRFDRNPCKSFMDPHAPWRASLDMVQPRLQCPMKQGVYHVRNLTFNSALLHAVPLPWEGNVWLVRFAMMDTRTRYHVCMDEELHVHRVRD